MNRLMINLPEQKTLLKVILAAIPFVALIITIRHHKEKVKLELFQRRYAVFAKLKELIAAMIIQQGIDERELLSKQLEINEVKFLFDKKICRFVDDIYRKNSELEKLKIEEHPELTKDENKKLELKLSNYSGNTYERNQSIYEKRDEIIASLAGDFNRIDLIFAKYLKFKK